MFTDKRLYGEVPPFELFEWGDGIVVRCCMRGSMSD